MSVRYDVNCSILFTELPILERAAAAKAAGFGAVEFWWPFSEAVPADDEVDRFVGSIRDSGVRLVGLNFFAGDMPAGDRGLVSWPGREQEFRDNVDVAVGMGEQLGCGSFNALYGNRISGAEPSAQDDLALENLVHAANAASAIGGSVLVEAVSGADRYPVLTALDAVNVTERVNRASISTNCRFLADLYHLTVNRVDLEVAISAYAPLIGHVQIADAPGRGEPGTGGIDVESRLDQLDRAGYAGWVGLEYKPTLASADSFGWLDLDQRASGVSTALGSEGVGS